MKSYRGYLPLGYFGSVTPKYKAVLPKVVSMVNANSDSEVEDVFDEHTNFMASTGLKCGSDSGYGTNSLLEQWMKTNQDDDYDPYNDDMYDSHDMSRTL
ncbi:hypothetical protein Tco_1476437 [Tanacetum coccineum]